MLLLMYKNYCDSLSSCTETASTNNALVVVGMTAEVKPLVFDSHKVNEVKGSHRHNKQQKVILGDE